MGPEIKDLMPVNPKIEPGASTVYNVHSIPYYVTNYMYMALMAMSQILTKDKDAVIIVDGKERSGKSVLAQQIAWFLDKTFDIDRICFTPQEFTEAIKNAPRYGAIILDEALTTLFSRQAMTKNNVDMVKTIAEVGQKNLILLVVLPTFFDLDKYISIWRAVGLFHVRERDGYRGHYDFYGEQELLALYTSGKQFYNYDAVRPRYHGQFQNVYTVPEDEYRKKKHNSLMNSMNKNDKNPKRDVIIKLHNEGLSIRKIKMKMDEVGLPLAISTIGGYVKEYEGK